MTKLALRRNAPIQCPCGRAAPRKTRQQRYCSEKCRKRKWGEMRCRKAGLGRDTGEATNPIKFVSNINGLQATKSRPSPCILAPAVVIDRELFAGRKWERVTSEDGVSCLIVRKAA